MIVKLTPDFKFVCDRCGKEEFPNEAGYIETPHEIEFNERKNFKSERKNGEVCSACAAEFWEFANNFFDEVNKETSEGG